MTFLPTFLMMVRGYNLASASALVSVAMLATLVAGLLFGLISDLRG